MIKAIIFDCDGTLFDSETPSSIAWQEIFDKYNIDFPIEEWVKCLGSSAKNFDGHAYLQTRVREKIDKEGLLKRRMQRKIELTNLQGLREGVQTYIRDAKNMGLKLGVASSSSREWVLGHLERLNIKEEFDFIVCADDVESVKPHPELYIKATEGLALDSSRVIAIEDSPNGISSARSAGIFCVAVPNELTAQLDLNNADLKINSLSEMELGELLVKIQEIKNNILNK